MTVFAYCRVSTGRQLHGLSMEIQSDDDLLKNIALKFNTSIGKVYSDKGKSAYKGHHLKNEFGKLLEDIEKKSIKSGDIIVVRHLDRISRSALTDGLKIFIDIVECGIKIYTTMDGKIYSDDQISIILATLAFKTANEESVRKSYYTLKNAEVRIKNFIDGIRDDGYSINIGVGHNPFYVVIDDKKIKRHPVFFEAMKEVINRYIDGYSLIKCCEYLDSKYNHKITVAGLNEALNSKALFGTLDISLKNLNSEEFVDNSIIKKNYILSEYYPPLCDESKYYKIQKIKSSRSTSDNNKKQYSLLSGGRFLHCECEGYMCTSHSKKDKKYYRCYKCGYLIPSFTLDLIVFKACISALISDEVNQDNNKSSDTIENIRAEIDFKEKDLLLKSDLVYGNPLLFGYKASELLSQKKELDTLNYKLNDLIDASSSSIDNYSRNLDYFKDFIDKHESNISNEFIDKKECHEKFKKIIKNIIVSKDGLVYIRFMDLKEVFYYLPTDYNKNTGVRFGLELKLVSESDKENIIKTVPDLIFKYFTREDIFNKKYLNKVSVLPETLLRVFSSGENKKTAFEKNVDKIKSYIKINGFIIWKKKFVLNAIPISERQWLSYKDEALYEKLFKRISFEYVSEKGNFCKGIAFYISEIPMEKELLKILPYSPKNIIFRDYSKI